MKKSIFIFVLAFTVICVGFSKETYACFIAAPSDYLKTEVEKKAFIKDFDKAQTIFAGKVIAIDRFRVKFKVDKVWKGDVTEEFVMSTGTVQRDNGLLSLSSCDFSFKLNESYLVFTTKLAFVENTRRGTILPEFKGLLRASESSRTKPLKEAKQGIKNLNKTAKSRKPRLSNRLINLPG